MASKIYNGMLIDILRTFELQVFKKKLKLFLIDKTYTIHDSFNDRKNYIIYFNWHIFIS